MLKNFFQKKCRAYQLLAKTLITFLLFIVLPIGQNDFFSIKDKIKSVTLLRLIPPFLFSNQCILVGLLQLFKRKN